eukprot:gene20334-64630_t
MCGDRAPCVVLCVQGHVALSAADAVRRVGPGTAVTVT